MTDSKTARAFAAPTSAPEGTVPTAVPRCLREVSLAVTHPGVFHADDVLAGAILRLCFPEVKIHRLPRPADAAAAARLYADADVVFDVGGAYEPRAECSECGASADAGPSDHAPHCARPDAGPVLLDHHQRGKAGQWRDGVELSSAGLVWCSFKHRLGLSSAVEEMVEDRLIKPVDAIDNGQRLLCVDSGDGVVGAFFSGVEMPGFSTLISGFNPSWRELEDRALLGPALTQGAKEYLFRSRYDDAVLFARQILVHLIESCVAEAEAQDRVGSALIANRPRSLPDVVVFDRYYPGMIAGVLEGSTMIAAEPGWSIVFIVYPDEAGTWLLQCVPPSDAPADRFKQRTPLPATWAGLRGAKLAEATGVGDSVFCHPGRFICGAGSKEGALALARLVLGRI